MYRREENGPINALGYLLTVIHQLHPTDAFVQRDSDNDCRCVWLRSRKGSSCSQRPTGGLCTSDCRAIDWTANGLERNHLNTSRRIASDHRLWTIPWWLIWHHHVWLPGEESLLWKIIERKRGTICRRCISHIICETSLWLIFKTACTQQHDQRSHAAVDFSSGRNRS